MRLAKRSHSRSHDRRSGGTQLPGITPCFSGGNEQQKRQNSKVRNQGSRPHHAPQPPHPSAPQPCPDLRGCRRLIPREPRSPRRLQHTPVPPQHPVHPGFHCSCCDKICSSTPHSLPQYGGSRSHPSSVCAGLGLRRALGCLCDILPACFSSSSASQWKYFVFSKCSNPEYSHLLQLGAICIMLVVRAISFQEIKVNSLYFFFVFL